MLQSITMLVSRKNVSRNDSVRPTKAINSAYTGAGTIKEPLARAASSADRAAALRASSTFHSAAITLLSTTVAMGSSATAQFPDRPYYCLPTGARPAVADPAILFERTAGSYRTHMGSLAVAFK